MIIILCPKGGSLDFTPPGDEMCGVGFALPSSQTIIIMSEQLVQGRYTVAWGRFEPVTSRLQGTEHTTTPPRPNASYYFYVCQKISNHKNLWSLMHHNYGNLTENIPS